MDIVGPLPIAVAQKMFLLVATDSFRKWVEAEAYASIKDKDVSKFVWKNIICWFRVSQVIVIDNGPQFDNIVFRTFCSELNINNLYSTPRYPQNNGQTETINKTLLSVVKKLLEGVKKKLVDELFRILWLTGQHLDGQQGPLLLPLLIGWRSLFQLRLACLLPK